MTETFEAWYCETYWNFKTVPNRQVFFVDGKYNHFDVDLAYNAYEAGRAAERVECAEIAENCDKSTHPSDVAEAIRQRGEVR